jgi:hypothetical protein
VRKGTYTAVIFSLLIHGLILFVILITQSSKQKVVKPVTKISPIKSFIYYAPNIKQIEVKVITTEPLVKETLVQTPLVEEKEKKNNQIKAESTVKKTEKSIKESPIKPTVYDVNKVIELPKTSINTSKPKPLPKPTTKKLDSFTQLQRLRSKLNQSAITDNDNPYQSYQPPSAFNTNAKTVPHSAPLKDEQKERDKNTKNMGAGIAITKGEDGRCSVTQDLSAYGLSEGSSTQYFSCGESKFDKSFREHMKKVNNKLGKN